MRLFAAGELSFAFVPGETDERFRDLVRCIEDVRKHLMRSRHRSPCGYSRPGPVAVQAHARAGVA